MSARQLSRLLDPADDYMLLVIGDAHRVFGSPQAPPQVRILISPPAAVTIKGGGNTSAAAAAAAGGAAHAQQQRQFKHGPRSNAHTGTTAPAGTNEDETAAATAGEIDGESLSTRRRLNETPDSNLSLRHCKMHGTMMGSASVPIDEINDTA